VKSDYPAAAHWYRAAALKGNGQAQANLGQLYYYGRGLDRDLVAAYAWFKLSDSQGNNLGKFNLENLQSLSLLDPNQRAEGEKKFLELKGTIGSAR
jgi:TPR repeat protein